MSTNVKLKEESEPNGCLMFVPCFDNSSFSFSMVLMVLEEVWLDA